METSQTIGRPVVNWKPLRARVIASNLPPLVLFSPPPQVPSPSLHPFSSGCSIPSVGVAINAPLKEIGNPFVVRTFVVECLRTSKFPRGASTDTHIHTVGDFAFHLQGDVSPRPLFILPRVHSAAAPREGEIAFTWSLESISRSRDTIDLFFRIGRGFQEWR